MKESILFPDATEADIRANVDMSKVADGYFSSLENINHLITTAIEPILNKLPQKISYADFGGGNGIMAKAITNYLTSKNFFVDTLVLDANKQYLQEAKKRGLKTNYGTISAFNSEKFDLITMRSVNHYNPIDIQKEMFINVKKSLEKNGLFISQILSASSACCQVVSKILNLPELGRVSDSSKIHITSKNEYKNLLLKSGFNSVNHLGEAHSYFWNPEVSWKRFNPTIVGNESEKNLFNQRHEAYLDKANKLINSLEETVNGEVALSFPIFMAS